MSTLKRTLKRGGRDRNNIGSSVLPDDDVQGIFRQLESPHFLNYDEKNQQQSLSTSPKLSPTKETSIIHNYNNGDSPRLVNFLLHFFCFQRIAAIRLFFHTH